MVLRPGRALAIISACAFAVQPAYSECVKLFPMKDNTLYQSTSGSLSNGAGIHFFTGLTAQSTNRIRRGLLSFNVAGSLPAGAVIESVSLRLWLSASAPPSTNVTLHRVLADWGESTSNASGEEGGGGTAATGDVTWVHRFRATLFWTGPGGQFDAAPSATTLVEGQDAYYTWSSTPQMVSDVQGWLNAPGENFGWLVKGVEAGGASAKRFDTREHPTPQQRPLLTIHYSMPNGIPADMNCDGQVDTADVEPFVLGLIDPAGYQAAHPACDRLRGDLNEDCLLDAADIPAFLTELGV